MKKPSFEQLAKETGISAVTLRTRWLRGKRGAALVAAGDQRRRELWNGMTATELAAYAAKLGRNLSRQAIQARYKRGVRGKDLIAPRSTRGRKPRM